MEVNPYLSMFIEESKEHLQELNNHLLELEAHPENLDIVQHIFRSAHTLKGMSATMGYEDLASLTHEMENILDLIRNGNITINSQISDVLFQSLDLLEFMVEDIVTGGTGSADVQSAIQKLKNLAAGNS